MTQSALIVDHVHLRGGTPVGPRRAVPSLLAVVHVGRYCHASLSPVVVSLSCNTSHIPRTNSCYMHIWYEPRMQDQDTFVALVLLRCTRTTMSYINVYYFRSVYYFGQTISTVTCMIKSHFIHMKASRMVTSMAAILGNTGEYMGGGIEPPHRHSNPLCH